MPLPENKGANDVTMVDVPIGSLFAAELMVLNSNQKQVLENIIGMKSGIDSIRIESNFHLFQRPLLLITVFLNQNQFQLF